MKSKSSRKTFMLQERKMAFIFLPRTTGISVISVSKLKCIKSQNIQCYGGLDKKSERGYQ